MNIWNLNSKAFFFLILRIRTKKQATKPLPWRVIDVLEYINKIIGCLDGHRTSFLKDNARDTLDLNLETVVMLKVSKILKNGIELPVALTLRLPNILHIFGTCEYSYVTKTQLVSCDYCFFDCCCLSYIDVFVAGTLTTCKYVVACFFFPQKAYSMPFPTFGWLPFCRNQNLPLLHVVFLSCDVNLVWSDWGVHCILYMFTVPLRLAS